MIIVGTPHARNAGYYLSDNRNAGQGKREADIRTCPHCQAIIKMQEWQKAPEQNFCIKCMAPACNRKECHDCKPFIQQIERYVEAQVRRKQLSRILGL